MSREIVDLQVTNLVFVYGSLKSGQWNHDLLSGCNMVEEEDYLREGRYLMSGSGVPCIYPKAVIPHVDDDLFQPIKGQVWEIDSPRRLQFLDYLEGHPRNYYRTLTTTVKGHFVWLYVIPMAHWFEENSVMQMKEGKYYEF